MSLSISWSLPKFMFIASVMPSSHRILWHPLLLPSIFPTFKDFANELSVCIRWPNYWSFSFSISPSSEYSGLISLKIEWFALLAVQSTFRSLPQHHSLKASILWHSAFFMVQLSQPYVPTVETITLTIPAKWYLCFSTHCLCLSLLSCQEVIVFSLHDCSHHPQVFWSPRRGNLSLLPPFPLLFAVQ